MIYELNRQVKSCIIDEMGFLLIDEIGFWLIDEMGFWLIHNMGFWLIDWLTKWDLDWRNGILIVEIGSWLTDEMGSRLTDEMGSQLTDEMGSRLTDEMGSRLTAKMGSRLTAKMGSRLTAIMGMQTLCGPLLQCMRSMCIWSWSKFGCCLIFHGNTCSSQSGMNPCVQWCPTSHPSLGWLFCEKWWKNILNHQIELFCNKCGPWLAMVWVIPGWDDPR